MLDFRYLMAFTHAAKSLNFARAAEQLKISPSALSRQIRLLEQSHGKDLFLRSTRRVTLTAEGERLLSALKNFEREVAPPPNGEAPLRMGSLESVFHFFVAGLMSKYSKHFSGAIDIVIDTPQGLEAKVASGELDLVFTNIAPRSSNLTGFKLFQESVAWFKKARNARPIVFSAFENLYHPETALAPDRIKINSFQATVELVRRGSGRSLIPLPAKIRRAKPGDASQWIYAVTPQFQYPHARLVEILRILRRKARSFDL